MNQFYSKKTEEMDSLKNINRSLELLKSGLLEEAQAGFSEVLKNHYSDSLAESGIKCTKYWIPRLIKLPHFKTPYEKGKYLFEEWPRFIGFISHIRGFHRRILETVSYCIFSKSLDFFNKEIEKNPLFDLQTVTMIACCYKKIGDYQNAISSYEKVISQDPSDANIIANIADCYALIDDIKKAKVLFREAFFMDPINIELDSLESEMMQSLILKIKEISGSPKDINSWIPVYGRIFNILDVYREILPVELGRIKQEIYHLEKMVLTETEETIKARLINLYLWLLDFYRIKNQQEEAIKIVEENIKIISNQIYSIYKNNIQETK